MWTAYISLTKNLDDTTRLEDGEWSIMIQTSGNDEITKGIEPNDSYFNNYVDDWKFQRIN